VSVHVEGDSVEVVVDGGAHRGTLGEPLEVPW
jgi:hypothetical protein